MWLRKERGESGIGPHHWPHDGAVIEVPDQLAGELLNIPGAGYSKADGPEPEPKAAAKPAAAAAKAAPAAAAPAKTAGKDAG